jgi:hypothetical protein
MERTRALFAGRSDEPCSGAARFEPVVSGAAPLRPAASTAAALSPIRLGADIPASATAGIGLWPPPAIRDT